MTDTVKMNTVQGVRDAHRIEEREYREIEGSGIAVSRGGKVFIDEDFPEIDDFPWMTVVREDGIYRAHVPAAVAFAWLEPEARDKIRDAIPASVKATDPKVKDAVKEQNVWAWAIAHVANTPEDDMILLDEKPVATWGDKEIFRVENANIEDYKTFLVEYSRPPSKGGNTSAMHSHAFWIDGQKYSFLARGARKFVFKDDTVSFDYYVTEDGYRNILRHSIVCRDKNGKTVLRGDRRNKAQLRSAPTRLPGSRREQRS